MKFNPAEMERRIQAFFENLRDTEMAQLPQTQIRAKAFTDELDVLMQKHGVSHFILSLCLPLENVPEAYSDYPGTTMTASGDNLNDMACYLLHTGMSALFEDWINQLEKRALNDKIAQPPGSLADLLGQLPNQRN